MDVSSGKEREGGQGGNSNAVMKPNNAVDRRMCAYVFLSILDQQAVLLFNESTGGMLQASFGLARFMRSCCSSKVGSSDDAPANCLLLHQPSCRVG